MRPHRLRAVAVAAALLVGLTACGGESGSEKDGSGKAGSGAFPVTIEHALGRTTIPSKPERVATVNWANHEVPLALGVVPVGMAAANFGDDDGDGVLPWVEEKLKELDARTPVLFDETDGIDFEAVADTKPDVILASYSGLTQQDYDTLSDIAPVVAYPEAAWATPWREIVQLNSKAIGLAEEGEKLIGEVEGDIEETVAKYPQLTGKSAMFMTHVDPNDVSEVGFYTAHDTRTLFFEDLGLKIPGSIAEASKGTDKFALSKSAEQIDAFDDVDIITGYGDDKGELLETLRKDPLLSKIPAVERGSVYLLPGSAPLATAANPTPLSISWVLEDYVAQLAKAADKVK
ncbi:MULTISPECIES: iron-siderophore ABC transporter substrate-binding protein [unclassified Streptomyces]|uniref:iron-siderophore ABC transporter substrate-binding protein n=1 Tax=unclassified Streptomyces TaxID=2593676 RepID=UPI0011CCB394|nr:MULTISPECIES: iron-siderophore ABC transporter substrate-binding protein [unclassified Streptomyces]TXS18674.1 iron-siderophore ABC transporter substrate-binding protein [Streptomyces sp. wa22]WSQ76707.1 iron-siderophore ABC transporter substrate-binding protein [Streptomyces sp. NBC_01213]WSR10014.1 iron-siderophore ABC transporter substrate-binding protein [Streptomyces sp. NBC_01208]WSR47262.1 iron-siderophore ABC transporter substrate-binding protein [Streptomyces sp. NBC_01201]